jgi:ammonia channel protein AmtB
VGGLNDRAPETVKAFVAIFILLKLIDLLVCLGVSEQEETLGLDLTQHSESAYID